MKWIFLLLAFLWLAPAIVAQPTIPRESIPKDIRPWLRKQIERLYSEDPGERSAALSGLTEYQEPPPAAMPFVLAMLGDNGRPRQYVVLLDVSAPADEADDEEEDRREVGWAAVSVLHAMAPPIAQVLPLLESKDPTVRARAASLLGSLDAPKAVPALIGRLKDDSPVVRRHAAQALGFLGNNAAMQPLQAALQDTDKTVRADAAAALVGFADARADAPVLAMLKSRSPDTRLIALKALTLNGRLDAGQCIGMLKDSDPKVRGAAARALLYLDAPGRVDALLAALNDPDAGVRAAAVASLEQTEKERTEKPILALLEDPDPKVRLAAATELRDCDDPRVSETLGSIMLGADQALSEAAAFQLGWRVPDDPDRVATGDRESKARAEALRARRNGNREFELFTAALKHRDGRIRLAALKGVWRIHDARSDALGLQALKDPSPKVRRAALHAVSTASPAFQSALKDPDVAVRREAAFLMTIDGLDNEPAVLLDAVKDVDATVRQHAIWALQNADRKVIVDPMIAALRDESADVRSTAATVLGRTRDPRARDVLLSLLQEEDDSVRDAAAMALDEMEATDARAVEPMIRVLDEGDMHARRSAASYLGRCADPRAIQPLITALTDAGPYVRATAAEGLANYSDERAVAPLRAALKDPNDDVRQAAAAALRNQPQAIALLTKELNDPDGQTRLLAVQSLIESDKPEAMPALIAAAGNRDPAVQEEATKALIFRGRKAAYTLWYMNRTDRQFNADELARFERTRALVKQLEQALTHDSPAVRSTAAYALGNVYGREYYDGPVEQPCGLLLIERLKDPHPDVRRAAARALGEMRELRGFDAMLSLVKDSDPDVRAEAVQALESLVLCIDHDKNGDMTRSLEAQKAVIGAVADDDTAVYRAASACLQGGPLSRITDVFLSAAKGAPPHVREVLIGVTPEGHVERLQAVMIDGLGSPSAGLRRAAARRLASWAERLPADWRREYPEKACLFQMIDPLAIAAKDADPEVSRAAVSLLQKIGGARAADALKAAAAQAPSSAAEAASRVDALDTVEQLIQLLEGKDWSKARSAVRALHELGDPRAVEPLIRILEKNSWLAAEAALALGNIGDARAVEPLIPALNNTRFVLPWNAARALGAIGGDRAIEALIAALGNARPDARRAAASGLGWTRDARAVEPLINLLNDADNRVVTAAEISLGMIRDARAVDALAARAKQDKEACRALIKIDDGRAIDALLDQFTLGNSHAIDILANTDRPDLLPRLVAMLGTEHWQSADRVLKFQGDAAADALADAATNDDPTLRKRAMFLLCKMGDPRAMAAFASVVRPEDEALRKAVNAPPAVASQAAVKALLQALGDPDVSIRDQAVTFLGSLHDDRVIPGLIDCLVSGDRLRSRGAGRALGMLGDPLTLKSLIAAAQIRASAFPAVEAIGKLPGNAAVPALLDIAARGLPQVRSTALAALRGKPDPRVVVLATNALKDTNGAVSVEAARVLASMGAMAGAETAKALQEVLNDNYVELVHEAIAALATVPGPESVDALAEAIRDRRGDIRELAVQALGRRNDTESVAPLLGALKDEEPEVRAAAVQSLGWLRDGRAVPELVALLEDEGLVHYQRIGALAAAAIAEIDTPDAAPLLIKALGGKQNAAERAAWALGRMRDTQALGALITASAHNYRAVEALGGFDDPRVTQPLIDALDDWGYNRSAAAARAIGRLRRPEAVNALCGLLKADHVEPRTAAFAALEALRSPDMIEPARLVLENLGQEHARAGTARALGKVEDERVPGMLEAALRDPSLLVRVEAAAALYRMGRAGDQMAALLADALANGYPEEREAAASAMQGCNDPRYTQALIAALRDDTPAVRQNAARALGALHAANAIEPLGRLLGDRDYDVAQAAADALAQIGDTRATRSLCVLIRNERIAYPWAARALGDLKDPAAIPVLELARERGGGMLFWSAYALFQLGFEQDAQLNCIAEYMRDADRRQEAATALAHIRDPRAVGHLIYALAYAEDDLQDDVWKALREITRQQLPCDVRVWRQWWQEHKDAFNAAELNREGGRQ